MSLPIFATLAGLAILTVWGFISPRTQWRALLGWHRSDGGASEPGAVAVTVVRIVSGLAIVALVVGWMSLQRVSEHPNDRGIERAATDPLRELWGTPDPVVVNRIFSTVAEPSADLVLVPLVRYQSINGTHRDPSYLFDLDDFTPLKAAAPDGFIGTNPSAGLTALDSADLVVQVVAGARCIPQQVYVSESSTAVEIAVYYGLPQPNTGADTAACTPTVASGGKTVSTLIPINLGAALGSRAVLDLDGTAVPKATTKPVTPTPTPTPAP